MSEVKWYTGKLKKVDKQEYETLEDVCKRVLGEEEVSVYYNSYEDQLLDTRWNEYITFKGDLYEVETRNEKDEYDSMFEVKDNGDGTFEYDVRYYDGSFSFGDAIDYAFRNMNERK